MALFLHDIYMVASNKASSPSTLRNYKLIGSWDVSNGGSQGTSATTGTNMMGLYASFLDVAEIGTSYRIGEILLTATNATVAVPPAAPADQASYHHRGTWDVDGGGAVGTNGTRGSGVAGLYVRETTGIAPFQMYISDIYTTASNDSFPVLPPGGASNNYHLVGYWDCDSGGALGTDNKTNGSYMMGIWVQWSPYIPA